MPFKIQSGLSPKPTASEAADFMELHAWIEGRYSATQLENHMSRAADQIENTGIDDEDDELQAFTLETLTELDRRAQSARGMYPFDLGFGNLVLQTLPQDRLRFGLLYMFFLLATRLKMTSENIHAGLDGTVLFEKLCARALKTYLGTERAHSLVFGTSERGSFEEKVNFLCSSMGEGGRYRKPDQSTAPVNDDGLDVVAWLPFADKRSSQISVFGQCKTGTSWRSELSRLNPEKFTGKWMSHQYILPPEKAYFLTEVSDNVRWNETSRDAGLLFDRCRVFECLHNLPDQDMKLFAAVETWAKSALNSIRK